MIDFDKHLKELLYNEDFIIVPGLGAFIASFSQAKINEDGELIEPHKTFEFNGLLNVDDGNKFVNYILGKENLPKAEIEIQLKDYLFEFKSKLNANTRMVFANVCLIQRNEDGQLIGMFNSDENYYVKPSFTKEEKEFVPSPSAEVIAETPVENVVIQSEQEENEAYTADFEEEYEEEKKRNWIKYLLYIVPLFLLFGALYYVVLYKPFKNNDIPSLDSELVSSEESNSVDSTGQFSNESYSEAEDFQEPVQETDNGPRFEVSAGLFKKKENADKLVEKMKNAGFQAEIKLVNGMRRVYVPVNGIDAAEAMSVKIEQFTGDKSVYFDENGISNR